MYKYVIFFLIAYFIPLDGFPQAPGGVAGPTVWIQAGSQTAGSMSTTGLINNGSIGDFTTIGGAATLNSTTNLVNFNPAMVFDGSSSRYSIANPYGASTSITDFAVGTTNKTALYGTFLSGDTHYWGIDFQNSGTSDLSCWRAGGVTNADVGKVYGIFGIAQPNGTASDNRRTINGLQSTYADATYSSTNGGSICIGSYITTGTYYYDGSIHEIIEYTTALSTADMNKVNSYLALKYAISMENTVSYVSSAGTTFWDAAGTNTGYENNIFGIGTDNAGSGLRVAQAKSYPNGPIAVYKGTLETLNSSNTSLDAVADGNFVMFGSNGSTGYVAHTYGGDATVNARSAEVWKLQVTGAAITTFNVNTDNGFPGGTPKYVMISNDPTFAAGVTYYAITNNAATNITVPATGQYMAIAVLKQYPGGVSGAKAWFRADVGVTSSGDGTDVTNWTDASGNGYDVEQATVTDRPEHYTTTADKLINFNPTIDYTNNEFLENNTALFAATSAYSFIAVATDEATSTTYKTLYACDDATNNWSFYKQGDPTTSNGWEMWIHAAGPYQVSPGGIGFSGTAGSNGYFNGTNYTEDANTQTITPQISALTGIISPTVYPITYIDGYQDNLEAYSSSDANYFQQLGIGAEVACSGCEPWTGRIPEFIAYDAQLTAAEMTRVNSYLAIKYGITLGQGGTNPNIFANDNNYDYQASDATVIWDATTNTTYKYHIAGIGRDDNSGLDQEQSQSQNPDFQPIIGNASEVTTSNAAHSGSFSADKSFLTWGCDGASTRFTTAFAFGNLNYRMVRIWKVQESGTVGTVKVAIAKNDAGILIDPALLVSTDATFDGSDTRTDMTEETIGGVDYYTATYDFSDGDYFTFGHYQTYPGGVSGTIVWYKTDAGVTNTGEGGDVSEWTDASNNGYHAEQLTEGDKPEYYGTTASKLINFNPSIDFTNNEFLENNTPLMGATSDFSFFVAVVDENTVADYNTIFACDDLTNAFSFYKQGGATGDNGWNIWAHVAGPYATNPLGVGFSATGGDNGYYNGTNYTSDAYTKNILPQIAAITGTPDGVTSPVTYIDGNQANFEDYFDPNTHYFQELGIGAEVSCSGCEAFTGRIPEFFAYDANLSSAQVQKINTYLAIKYGVTLGQGGGTTTAQLFCNYQDYDYQATDATVVWDASANSTFKYDIAGIARDDAEALDQRISKSSNPYVTDVVTIALDNDFSSNNQDAGRTNTHANDFSYLIWGNDYGATTFSTTYNTSLTSRMTRKWKIQKTNFLDSVFVQVTDGDIANSTQYALIGNTTTAETGWKQICKATSAGAGNTITFQNADFINFSYFSISQVIETVITIGSTIPADNLCPAATTAPIYRGTLTTDAEGCSGTIDIATFNFTTSGTFVAADISKYQLWVNSVDDLGSATQIDNDALTPTGPAGTTETFTISGSTNFSLSSTYYFWITADIAGSPGAHTIIVNAINPRNISFTCGSVVGAGTVGGTQTILGEVVWDGGGADNNWTTAANWVDDIAPVADLTLNFAGAVRTTPVNDFAAGTNFNAIEFDIAASSFTLSGNAITITSGCSYPAINAMNNANTMLIENNITFSTNAPTIISTTDGTFNISGTIDNGGFDITNTCAGSNTYSNVISGGGGFIKNSAGPLTLSGTNTYTGGTTLNAGKLVIDNNSALGVTGDFTINAGTINSTTSTDNANNNPMSWNGDFSFLGTSNLDLGDGTVTMSASRQVTCSANALTVGGIINHNTLDLTKAGNGTLSFVSQAITLKALTINAGTIVASSGIISLAGDYYNDGTFTHNSGTLTFNGAVDQNISGSASETFNNLVINNTGTAPTNDINVGNPIDLVTNLTLTDGIVQTSDPAGLLTLLAGSTSDPGSIDSFVDGPMQKVGTTAFVFPLGDAARWARIAIGIPTGSETYKAEYHATPYYDITTMATSPSPVLYSVSNKENWELTRSGTEDAIVTLYWEDADWSGITDCSTTDLRIGHWNGNEWENNNDVVTTTGGCAGAVSGTISTVAAVTAFSPFTFASLNLIYNPLPIELLSFNATYNGETIDLNWETASEINNDYFTIERSRDGVHFETFKSHIPSGAKEGNSTSILNYYSTDETITSGIYYYRLKQTDFNGEYFYSSIEEINIDEFQKFTFNIAPNPGDGVEINFIINQEQGQETLIIITDILGQELYSKVFVAEKNGTTIYSYVPAQKLAAGVYLVSAIAKENIISRRLIVN